MSDPLDFEGKVAVIIGIYRDTESPDVYHAQVVRYGDSVDEHELLDSDNLRTICKMEIDELVRREHE